MIHLFYAYHGVVSLLGDVRSRSTKQWTNRWRNTVCFPGTIKKWNERTWSDITAEWSWVITNTIVNCQPFHIFVIVFRVSDHCYFFHGTIHCVVCLLHWYWKPLRKVNCSIRNWKINCSVRNWKVSCSIRNWKVSCSVRDSKQLLSVVCNNIMTNQFCISKSDFRFVFQHIIKHWNCA